MELKDFRTMKWRRTVTKMRLERQVRWAVDQDTPKIRAERGGDMELDPVTSPLFPHWKFALILE